MWSKVVYVLRVKLSNSDETTLKGLAVASGLNTSQYVRSRLFCDDTKQLLLGLHHKVDKLLLTRSGK